MSDQVGEELRRLVWSRAEGLCEYCLIHADDTYFGCEVDHISSRKHGGPTEADNLALACFLCNRHKGSDIGSLLPGGTELIRLFHPRRDRWSGHFLIEGSRIRALTSVGEVTVNLLGLNAGERILERRMLIAISRFPSPPAKRRLQV
jgi:hypothetical protein